jgi:hypothetical protein
MVKIFWNPRYNGGGGRYLSGEMLARRMIKEKYFLNNA